MKLADLDRVSKLRDALIRMEQWPQGSLELILDGKKLPFGRHDMLAFVRWRRQEIAAELRALGVEWSPEA